MPQPSSCARVLLGAALLTIVAGCGRTKFEQEVETETTAVNLVRHTQAAGYELITTDELKKTIDSDQQLLLVDTMPAEDFARERIPGSTNFPLPMEEMKEWDDKLTGGKKPEDFARFLGEDKNRLIVFYCGFTACGRSHNGAAWARRLGYTNVKRQPGGLFAWKGAGHTVEK